MDQPVVAGRHALELDVLALEGRHVVVAVARRDALANAEEARAPEPALLRPDGLAGLVRKLARGVETVAETKPRLAVGCDQLPICGAPELVALEAEEM